MSNNQSLLNLIKGISKEERFSQYLTFVGLLSEREGAEFVKFYKASCLAVQQENSSTRAPGRLELNGEIIPQGLPYNISHNIASLLAIGEIRDASEEKLPSREDSKSKYRRKSTKIGAIGNTLRSPNNMDSMTGRLLSSSLYH